MKHFKKIALILCLPLALTGCGVPELADGTQVVAEVDGKQFIAEDLFEALKEDYGTGVLVSIVDEFIADSTLTEDELKIATENANSELEAYKAMYSTEWNAFLSSYGFNGEEDFLNTLISYQKLNLTVESYVASDVIKEEDITKYYEENIYGEITARHILIEPAVTDDMTGTETEEAEETALNEAKEIIEQLKNSTNLEEDFSNLAKEKSDDEGSASTGGLYENFTNNSGFVDEFWEASLELEVGKFTETPVETEFGYHIIYKVSQNEKPSLETVREQVIDSLVEELMADENASAVYWAALREKFNFKIYDSNIEETYEFSLDSLNE